MISFAETPQAKEAPQARKFTDNITTLPSRRSGDNAPMINRDHWNKVFTEPDYFNSIAKQKGLAEGAKVSLHGDDYIYRQAMIGYLADSRKVPVADMRDIFDAEKDSFAQKVLGKQTASAREMFDWQKSQYQRANEKQAAARQVMEGVIQRSLQDALSGGDTPFVESVAKDIDALGDLFDEEEKSRLWEKAEELDINVRRTQAQVAPEARFIFDALQQSTGQRQGWGAPDMREMAGKFAQLPDNQRKAVYELVGGFAQLQKVDKGFWYQMAESLGRGASDIAERVPRNAKEQTLRGNLRLLESEQPVFAGTGLDGTVAYSAAGTTPITPEQREQAKADIRSQLGVLKVERELRDLAERVVDPIQTVTALPEIVEEGLYGAARSLPYTAVAAVPYVGVPAVAAALYSANYDNIMLEYPDLDPDKAAIIAAVSAPIEAGLERMKVNTITGRLPFFGGLVKRLQHPNQRNITRIAIGGAGILAEQNAQEIIQNATFPFIQTVAAALDEDMPDYDWAKRLEGMPRELAVQFVALMPLSLMGMGALSYREISRGESYIRSKANLERAGYGPEQIDRITGAATAEEAQNILREESTKRDPEAVKAAAQRVIDEVLALRQQKNPAVLPRLEKQGADYVVTSPDGRVLTRTTDQTAAEQALLSAQRETVQREMRDVQNGITYAMDWIRRVSDARNRGEDITELIREGSGRNLFTDYEANPSADNLERLFETARVFGGDPKEPEDLKMFPVIGSNQGALREGIWRSIIRINDGADGNIVMREFAQDNLKRAVAEGRVTMDWVREQLNEILPQIESDRIQRQLRTDTDTDVIEAFSDVALAYFRGNIRDEQIPAGLRGIIRRLAIITRDIFRRAYNLARLRAEGKLDRDFEALLAEAVGVDQQALVDRARERTEQEVVEELSEAEFEERWRAMQEQQMDDLEGSREGGIDILDAVRQAGGLPSKTSSKVYQYRGELQRIRESQKGGNATGVKGTFNLFRKNAPDLDALIKDLQTMGFTDIETPSDLFELIERRLVTGRPIYGYEAQAMAEQMAHYSIGSLGESFPQFSDKPQEAIDHLLTVKQGYVPAAWNHPQIGEVDLIYGAFTGRAAGSGGLAKIAALRPELIATLGENFQNAAVDSDNENTIQLSNGGNKYVVRKTYFDNQMRWLLTAYKKDGEPASETIDTADPSVSAGRGDDKLSPQGSVDNLDAQTAEVKGQAASGEYPSTTGNYSIGLVSLHKLSEEKLRFADRMGGLAVPSIAVTKVGSPIQGFGEITLVAGQELGDPSLNPVYDADAYTSRFPKPEYKKVKAATAQKVVNFFKPFDARFASYYGDRISDVVWDNAVNSPNPDETIRKLTRSNVAKGAYLFSVEGVDIEPVMRPKSQRWGLTGTKAMQAYVADSPDINSIDYNDIAARQKLSDAVKAAVEEQVADKSPEVQKIMRDGMAANFEEDTGLLMFSRMSIVREDIQNYGAMEVDAEATGAAMDDALKGREALFVSWVESTIRDMYASPRIKVGGKWEPYTIENIVRVMTAGRIAGVEKTMAFGEGPARAAAARRFGSLNDLRNAADGLATESEAETARATAKEFISKWREQVIQFYKWDSTWDALDNSMQALARFYKVGDMTERGMQRALRSFDFVDVPAEIAAEGIAAARALMNTPVPYFESKPQRVVRLNEFTAAIVPKSVSVEAVSILTRHGLEVVSVESSNVDSPELQSALESVSQDISYSISTQSEIDRVQAAIGAIDRSPLDRLKVYEKMQERFLRVMADNRETLAAMEGGDLTQVRRTQILQALGELDGIITALPAEIRSKIGGYTQLAKVDPMDVFKGDEKISEVRGMSGAIISAWMREGLNIGQAQKKTELPAGYRAERNLDPTRADRAIADVFIQRINRINEVLEKFLRDEYNDAAVELFKRAKPQRSGAGEKPKGKLGADVHALFDTLKEATEWTSEQAQAWADGQWARIEAGELNPYEEAHAAMAAQVVPLFADWANADSTQRAAAVEMGQDILNRAYRFEQQRIVALRTKRGYDRMDLSDDAGVAADDDKARQEAAVRENTLSGKWEAVMLNLLNFDQVLKYIFGADSKVAKEISDRQRKADNAKSDGIAALSDDWAAFIARLGGGRMEGQQLLFDLSQMNDEIGGVKYSQNQLMAITMMWMQPKGRQHMEGYLDSDGEPVGKWHYNQDFVNKAEALLTPEAKAIREYLLRKYDEEYEAINKVYRKVYGLNLPKNQFYSPLTVEAINAPQGAAIDPVTGAVFAAGANSPSALRSRGGAIAQPVFRDAVQTYFGHMLQMEHWKAYAQFNSEAAALLGHRDTRNVVKGKAGEQAATVLNNWLTYFNQGGNKDAANHLAINQMINKVTGNFAAMALFGRISTLALQVTQLGAASAKMPTGAYLARFGKLMAGKLSWKAALDSDYIQRRIKDMPPAVALAMQGLRSEKPNIVREAARRLGQLISGFDGLFTAGTYAIVYDYQLAQANRNGLSGAFAEQFAREETERIVDEIAQPTRAGARSIYELNATNPVARAVWAFSSEARKNLGLTLYAGSKGGAGDFGKALFYVLVLNGLVATVVRSAFRDLRDDDDEEVFDEKNWGWKRMAATLISDPLYGFPVIGEALQSAIFNAFGVYTPSGPLFDFAPAVPAAKRMVGQYPFDLMDGELDFRDVVRDVNRILSTAGLFNSTIAGAASISNLGKDIYEVGDAQVFGE